MINRVGRFEIRRELGRGAQSVVYLGFDPQLQREVAIKTLHFSRPDPAQNGVLLGEARMVGKLRHPNLVPIFEAGEEDGDLYLVFEYVPGRNLADTLAQGALSPVRAATMMRDILGAVVHAHAQGIIHRDLKPSNILIDENGMPRVMDFGIAAPVDAAGQDEQKYSGTPAYMAPEYIDRHESTERSDVFSAGLIFYEMLVGQRAVVADGVIQILRRILHEDIRLPEEAAVDEKLAGIVAKALARDPALRYPSAAQFSEALAEYLDPDSEVEASGGGRQSTLDFLMRRMRHKTDFPALSESVGTINRIAQSETDSINKLSNSILKDFALTNKILRLVNSAYYRPAGGGSISTVSRAVIVLGFEAVRNIAVTVLLFEHLSNKANAQQLKEEFLRANLAGILAKDLGAAAKHRDLEQVFICSLFHNLGRLLTQYYFPEESEEIRRTIGQKGSHEDVASKQVLGISFEELGMVVARQWGFPPLIVDAMRRVPPGTVRKPATQEERLAVYSGLANDLCETLATATPETREREMKKALARYATAVPLDEKEIVQTIKQSVDEIEDFARIINVSLRQSAFGRQVRQFAGGGSPGEVEKPDTIGTRVLDDSPIPGLAEEAVGNVAAQAQEVLAAGIQDISNALVEGLKLNDILRIILETMYRAMGFKRVILCIRDPRSGTMQGRFGFGPDAAEIAKKFRFPLSVAADVFYAATSKGADILISDINEPKIAERIPAWYRQLIPAQSMVLFPLNIKGAPVALIYADRDEAGGISIPDRELSLLRTLRNQAVLAIKQGG